MEQSISHSNELETSLLENRVSSETQTDSTKSNVLFLELKQSFVTMLGITIIHLIWTNLQCIILYQLWEGKGLFSFQLFLVIAVTSIIPIIGVIQPMVVYQMIMTTSNALIKCLGCFFSIRYYRLLVNDVYPYLHLQNKKSKELGIYFPLFTKEKQYNQQDIASKNKQELSIVLPKTTMIELSDLSISNSK
ncbi:hypothetical protein WA158_007334 [Blastocystis sp. Blastoise]